MQRIVAIVLLGAGLLVSAPARSQVTELQQTSEQRAPAIQKPRPSSLNAQMHRARMAFESGISVMEAKVRVERVVKARPDDVEARKLRARVLLALDHPAAARTDARHATKLAPADGEAHLLLAETARLEGDTAIARQSLDQAAEHISDGAMLHVRLAWTAAHLGLLNRAEAYARTALALDSSLASAYYQLARVFLRKEQQDDAALILERGLGTSLLSPTVIHQDSLLHTLTDHRLLRGQLGQR